MNTTPKIPNKYDHPVRILLDLDASDAAQGVINVGQPMGTLLDWIRPDVARLEDVAQTLGTGFAVMLRASLGSGALSEYLGEQHHPGVEDELLQPVIALNVAKILDRGVSLVDLVVGELAHEAFPNDDARFATFRDWQRMQCGLPVPPGAPGTPGIDGPWQDALRRELLRRLADLDLSRQCVASLIADAFLHGTCFPGLPVATEAENFVTGLLSLVPLKCEAEDW